MTDSTPTGSRDVSRTRGHKAPGVEKGGKERYLYSAPLLESGGTVAYDPPRYVISAKALLIARPRERGPCSYPYHVCHVFETRAPVGVTAMCGLSKPVAGTRLGA